MNSSHLQNLLLQSLFKSSSVQQDPRLLSLALLSSSQGLPTPNFSLNGQDRLPSKMNSLPNQNSSPTLPNRLLSSPLTFDAPFKSFQNISINSLPLPLTQELFSSQKHQPRNLSSFFPNIMKTDLYNPSYDSQKVLQIFQGKINNLKDIFPDTLSTPTNTQQHIVLEKSEEKKNLGEDRPSPKEIQSIREFKKTEKSESEDEAHSKESTTDDGIINKKIGKALRKKENRPRVQVPRNNLPSLIPDSRIKDISAIMPEVYNLLGFNDLNEVKLRELLERAEYDERKFFIKLRRNLYYYKTSLKKTENN